MAKAKGFARYLPVSKIAYQKENGDEQKIVARDPQELLSRWGILVVKFDRLGAETADNFIRQLTKRKDWRKRRLENTLEIWYKKRSNEQNRLLWALLTVLSNEVHEEFGHEEELYYEIIDLISPTQLSKLTGRKITKRGSEMNTVQFNRAIEYCFRWFGQHGLDFTDTEDIRHYYVEWNNYRWAQKVDPMADAYKDIQDYRANVCYCEACLHSIIYDPDAKRYQEGHEGHIAHIVSRGSGGIDEIWNVLHLCAKCHVGIQHAQGWEKLIYAYPHLGEKVRRARAQAGKKAIPEERTTDLEEKDYLYYHPESECYVIMTESEYDEHPDPLLVKMTFVVKDKLPDLIDDLFNSGKMDGKNADQLLEQYGMKGHYWPSVEASGAEAKQDPDDPEIDTQLDIF